MAQYADLKASTVKKLKKMLAVISTLAPYKPNFESLASEIGVSRNNVPEYLELLEKAQLISQLRDNTGGMRGIGKVEKVYVDNPSLMSALFGGKSKGKKQIAAIPNSYIVKDDIEFAYGNIIPLWAFGLNY